MPTSIRHLVRLLSTLAIAPAVAAPIDSTPSPKVDPTPVLREVRVQDRKLSAGGTSSAGVGALGPVPAADLPYSAQSVDADAIALRGAHNLLQAVQGVAPIYAVMLPSNDGRGDAEPQLRGLDPNFLVDGLPLGSGIRPEVEACDRLDVVDGPTAAFLGFSGTNLGGTVDFRLKQPADSNRAVFGIGQYGGGLQHASADLGGFLDSARSIGYRFSAYREKGEGYVRGSDQSRIFALAAVEWKPAGFLGLRLSTSHHEFDFQGQQISLAVASKPWIPSADAMDANTSYGEPWTFTRGSQDRVLGGFEASLGPVALEGSSAFSHAWRQSRTVAGVLLPDASGNYGVKYSDAGPSDAWNWSGEAKARAKTTTGPVAQEIALGYVGLFNLQRSTAKPTVGGIAIDTSSIANPVRTGAPELFAAVDDHKRTRVATHTASLQDKAEIGPWAEIVAGLGWTSIRSRTDNELAGTASGVYHQDGLAPTVGAVAKPFPWLHPYANWSRGLVAGGAGSVVANPTRTNPSPKNAGVYLEPSTDDAFEAGVKSPLRLPGIDVDLSADVYWMDKVNEYTDPADSLYKQDGREIHRGAEIAASAGILSRLKVRGSFSWIDARLDKTQNGTLDGKEPVNVPEEIGRISLDYSFAGMPGLSAGVAANWSGERAVDDANTAWLPSWTTFDASIRYRSVVAGRAVSLQVDVANLADASYWAAYKAKGTVGLVLGEPRTVAVSATVAL